MPAWTLVADGDTTTSMLGGRMLARHAVVPALAGLIRKLHKILLFRTVD
jgi:hypothetical protein